MFIVYNVGESAADDSAILVTYSVMAQLAKKLNGVVVIMEHRFYGSSGPNVTLFFVSIIKQNKCRVIIKL